MQQLLHATVQCRHSQVAQTIDSAANPELGVPETADAAKQADQADVEVDSVDTPELGVAESAAKQAVFPDVAPSTIKATV